MENSFVVEIKNEIKIVEIKDINSLVLMNHDLSYREKPEVVTMQELLARNPKLIPTNKYTPKTLNSQFLYFLKSINQKNLLKNEEIFYIK
jgi:hypothetical protein